MHIPDDPRYYEKYYFTPGDLGFRVHETAAGRLGVLVCWDQWYPEAARLTALQGAEILIYPTAIGWHPEEKAAVGERQHAAWETIQRAHAIANGCFVVAINRSGFEPEPGTPDTGQAGIEFWGQSFVAGPDGRVIVRGAADREELLLVEIDTGEIERQRQGWPFLRDRRIDAYDGITRRFIDAAG
jgi:N-carbamoylputrescine amidase